MAKETRTLPEKFALRLPEGWLAKLGASAEANRRSTNAEIVARLEQSFQNENQPAQDEDREERLAMAEVHAEVAIEIADQLSSDIDDLKKRVAALEARPLGMRS
ncbi:Arc family DNA-binding protein [Methylocystis heyeri]|uniref:Arc family DNA-binding protein n=1 Tax=Methylocystis heyeri TaxID=391905 RepID=UPI0013893EC2|nr:Arc family DNA-binding protein [Methylocystis heyeri]